MGKGRPKPEVTSSESTFKKLTKSANHPPSAAEKGRKSGAKLKINLKICSNGKDCLFSPSNDGMRTAFHPHPRVDKKEAAFPAAIHSNFIIHPRSAFLKPLKRKANN